MDEDNDDDDEDDNDDNDDNGGDDEDEEKIQAHINSHKSTLTSGAKSSHSP